MAPIRRLVADVLKPHEPSMVEFAEQLAEIEGVSGATATLVELDAEVQNLKITVEGEDVPKDRLEDEITNLGGSLHSIDEVACGERVVEERRTLQD